jgi:hypothetical protein
MNFKLWLYEANSPEFEKRAQIISNLNDKIFNLSENGNKLFINIYNPALFYKVKENSNLNNNAKKKAVEDASIGGALLEMKQNPANVHIDVDPRYTKTGLGGMIYEIAIEYATSKGSAIAVSGSIGISTTSEDAFNVWNHFMQKRQNIIPIPISKYTGITQIDQSIAINIIDGIINVNGVDPDFNMKRYRYVGRMNNLSPEDIDELKNKFPAAFHVFKRNMYTIPQLEKAGKLLRMNNIDDLYNYLLNLKYK